MASLKGNMVGAIFLVRLGTCQYGSGKDDPDERCRNKTRMGIGVPVIDDPDLMGCRICPEHLERFVDALRVVTRAR